MATNSYPIFDSRKKIPEVKELVKHPEEYKIFIEHVTLNGKSLNWKIYKFSLNESSYRSFMFAFLIKCKTLDPTSVIADKFVSNAKKLRTFISQNKIELSEIEQQFLNYCCNYVHVKDNRVERAQFIETIFNNLYTLYVV